MTTTKHNATTTKMTDVATRRSDAMLNTIARHVLGLSTLEIRNSDRLDFHELGVAEIRRALRKAYAAGREDAVSDLVGVTIIKCRAFLRADEDKAYAYAQAECGQMLQYRGYLLVISADDVERIEQAGGPETIRFIDDQERAGTRTIAVGG